MNTRTHAVIGLLLVLGLLGSCAQDEGVSASCDLAATITFDGREYIAVDSLTGVKRRDVQVGERLGVGEVASCPGEAEQRVQVFALVGVPVVQAVFAKPVFGLMKRWNQDGSVK